ncbi:hypothetical protein PF010_g15505 [Phytophthora fragariae]|uniref:Tc1-like transposase DDE domain-containing protein n=1 Tax=Phytophthora fragariae TaxID=53985 RepID=A0A6G0KUA8_9STRA|nr:hypothetical protein PF010_g15505 [Phytophthora fragariae]KAE9214783.1 hypothetical protein PF004_g14947 [Phytophthora fragariae]
MPRTKKPPPFKESKKKPRLTERERGRIEGLHQAGVSGRDIARVTERSRDTVRPVVSPAAPTTPRPSGPTPALTDRETRRLVRTAAKGNLTAAKLKVELDLSVSVRTIQRTLAKVDWLVYTKMQNTLPLKPEDMLVRNTWASGMLLRKDSGAVWDSIIFSDEKKWNLDGPDGFQYYWRDLRKPPRQTKRRQAGGGSVMVWAEFSSQGKSPLVVLTGRQNSDDYVYTVSEYLLPFAHQNYGIDFIYQQDNTSTHRSKRTKEFFAEEDIKVLDWPSKSSDLNPIENLWSIMSRRVYPNGKQYDSMPQLKAALFEAWNSIPTAMLVSLIESMPRRCVEVLDKKGNKTHY